MRTYIFVSFISGVIAVTARGFWLAYADYPRMSESSRGSDVFFLFVTIGFMAWSAWLLWGAEN